ncbi:MAG: winged helix-turn-helix transcriptional regulator [Planctomycetes bacterium]|nr:winged helix-turn-helix transcriptional regulator [Planctomycetota bacterium]
MFGPSETLDVRLTDAWQSEQRAARRGAPGRERRALSASYRLKLGQEPIWLEPIEYRILTFLAARPYRAYTRQRIVRAVGTDRHPVMEEGLDRHIKSLRDKLGFFRDTIQTVPHVGYRFKA